MGLVAPWPYPSRTTVTEVDARDPARLRVVRHARARGRLPDGAARRPCRAHRPLVPARDRPPVRLARRRRRGDEAQATERNRAVVRSASARRWLPGFTVAPGRQGRRERRARRLPRDLAPSALFGPRARHRADDRRRSRPRPRRRGRDRLGRPHRLRLAHEPLRRVRAVGPARGRLGTPTETTTAIHRFDIASPTQTHYRGERLGAGRAARASGRSPSAAASSASRAPSAPTWWGGPRTESETVVTTLAARGGALVPLGRVGGLGKGERVYAVRFVGDVGLRRHLPSGRPALHARPLGARATRGARGAEDPRLLGLPAPRRRTTSCSGSGRTRPTRAGCSAPRLRSSTSPTCAARAGSTR